MNLTTNIFFAVLFVIHFLLLLEGWLIMVVVGEIIEHWKMMMVGEERTGGGDGVNNGRFSSGKRG